MLRFDDFRLQAASWLSGADESSSLWRMTFHSQPQYISMELSKENFLDLDATLLTFRRQHNTPWSGTICQLRNN